MSAPGPDSAAPDSAAPDGGGRPPRADDPGQELLDRLRAHRVVGIVRHPEPAVATEVGRALLRGGLACVEITWTVPRATEVIAELAAEFGDRYIGAGTVVRADQVDAVADAGARYVVTPAVRPAVIARCAERDIPTLTGVMTPTDLYAALDLGVRAVKVFPAGTLGPGHLAALKEIAPDVDYVPTGGIDASSAREWLDRGATAVAIASAFTAAWARGGAEAVSAAAAAVLAAVGSPPA